MAMITTNEAEANEAVIGDSDSEATPDTESGSAEEGIKIFLSSVGDRKRTAVLRLVLSEMQPGEIINAIKLEKLSHEVTTIGRGLLQ